MIPCSLPSTRSSSDLTMSCASVRAAVQALLLLSPVLASAQTLRLASRDTSPIVALPGTTVTAALRITNSSDARVTVAPRIEVPAEWSVPLGALPFALSAGESDSWILGIRVPSRAPAGRYRIAVAAQDSSGPSAVRDSLTVQVSTVRGLGLTLTNRPTYAVSGGRYQAVFLLQNNGNVPTIVRLRATSALGAPIEIDSAHITLAAGATHQVVARVSPRTKSVQALDDVLEVYALDRSDTTIAAAASARVTIVQEANTTEPLHRVASQLRLRAANADAGVSPYELIGTGNLRDDGDEQLSFVLRGSPGKMSQFGDQDEYRAELRGLNYTARLGDGLYSGSSLSGNGQAGFGVGLDVREGELNAGAFTQRYRRQLGGPIETGAYASVRAAGLFATPRLSMNALTRHGGSFAGQVLGAGAALRPLELASIDIEVAGSTGPLGRGAATSARVSGGDRVRYDVGHTGSDDNFAGISRGSVHDYADLSGRVTEDMQVAAAIGSHRSQGVILGLLSPQYFRSSTAELTYRTQFSLQYSSLSRTSNFGTTRIDESQHGMLVRSENNVGPVRVWGTAGVGTALTALSGRHPYHEMSLGGTAQLGRAALTLYGETSKGMSITRGTDNVATLGGDGRLAIGPSTSVFFNGFQTTLLGGGDHYAQLEGGISQALRAGSTLSLRMRLATNAVDERSRELAFLEYSTPLQLPIGRSRSVGRVRGRVLDQETGRGVAGTLVRLGPQAAITDDEGRVAFAGLPAGEYRLSIAQGSAPATTIIAGASTVTVDSVRKSPTTFAVAIERAALLQGSVRLMAVARTGIESAPDSLADAGPLESVSLALIGTRDTLYANTDARGAYHFPEVASGSFTLKVLTAPRAGTRWEPSEIEVSVTPATTRDVAIRLLPRRRAVQLIPGTTIPPKR